MANRKLTVFLALLATWTIAVAVFGVVNMPRTVLPFAFAHAPGFVVYIFVIWLLFPAIFLVCLAGRTPLGMALNRRMLRGRPTPADRRKWSGRLLVVVGVFGAFSQAWQTLALVLLWHKRQLPWVSQSTQGPYWAGLPDPHHLIPRLSFAASGVLIVWFGNGLPKLLSPFRGGAEPYDWSKWMRTYGWLLSVAGLVGGACSLFVGDLRTALLAGAAIIMTPFIAAAPIWAIYRFTGRHSVAPPERM